MKHINITVYGKVQGVNFRAATKAVANQLSVNGFVRNQADGTVYIEVEGEDFELENFLDFCKEGTEQSKVENIAIAEGDLQQYRNFEIKKR